MTLYTKFAQRSIPKNVSSMKTWNYLYSLISYLGILFNTALLVWNEKLLNSNILKNLHDLGISIIGENETEAQTLKREAEIFLYVFILQNILLMLKFVLEISIPKVSNWIRVKIIKEQKAKLEAEKTKTNILNRIFNEKKSKKIRLEASGNSSNNNQEDIEEKRSLEQIVKEDGGMKFDLTDTRINRNTESYVNGYRDEILDFLIDPDAENHYYFFEKNPKKTHKVQNNELMYLKEENVEFNVECII